MPLWNSDGGVTQLADHFGVAYGADITPTGEEFYLSQASQTS